MRINFLSKFLHVCLATAILAMFSGTLFAQSDNGSISGFIHDPSGAVVPNATVTVQDQATGNERKATTNESGYYTVTNLRPTLYKITAEAAGFKRYETSNNKLDSNSSLSVDATLTVGNATETVEVTSTAPALQSESAAVQKLVTRQQIDSLELNGRNPILMAQLVPGTRGSTLANLNFNFSQGPANINGARTPESLITYDGAPAVRTRSNGTSLGAADVDSTQEIQVMTANYGAEYGRSSGGQIRIVTKAGGTTFHGAAYEYLRNTDLNANTWARNNVPTTGFTAPIHYNQYGYNVGGPFYIPGKFNKDKNRFFWYWGQEWVKNHFTETNATSGNAGNLLVPSVKMRTGDFSELLGPNIFYSSPKQLKDPKTGAPIVGNIIPKSQLSPNGLGLLNAYPIPNVATPVGGGNWVVGRLHTQEQRKDQLNADINLTDSQRITFRRNNFAYLEYQPLDGNSDRTPKFFNRPNQTNSLGYIWTISPNVVNEALATVSLDDVYIPVDLAHFYNRGDAGINYPYIFPNGKTVPTRIPTVKIATFSDLSGGPYPSHSAGPIYTVSDTITWIKGNHTLKFGGYYERSGENDGDEINVQAIAGSTNNQNGQFQFLDGTNTGIAVANAAMGLFDTYGELGPRAYTLFRGSMTEAFAQDSWKATQKLHIDYGLRYSVIIPYNATWRNMAVFDPTFYNPAKAVSVDRTTGFVTANGGDLYNGMVIPGSGFPDSAKGRTNLPDPSQFAYLFRGVSPHYSDIQWGDVQPRLGIAYQLNDKTVIRVGAGRFVTRLGISDSVFLGGNPPFQPSVAVSNGIVDNPGGATINNYPLTVTTQSKAFKNPEAWNWNFTMERETFWNSVLSVGYVGRRGLHLQRESDINQPTAGALQANPGVNINALRPYLGYGSIRETDNIASSKYNSLQVAWNRRFANGVQFGLSYTLSKSMDDGSNQRDVIPNTYDAHSFWGPSEFDNRHTLVINYLYDLPIFRHSAGFKGKVLGGWQISGIAQFQTGTPCGVMASTDYAGAGLDANLGCGNNGQYMVLDGNPVITGQFAAGGSKDPAQWFATTNPNGTPIFTAPKAGTFNSQPARNLIYQPGFQNWNLGLFKAFAINERSGFQFRAEAFNFVNHPNWGGSSGGGVQFNPTNANFGKVTSKGSERNMQLSLRFFF
jgi:carboxypeptidase family protein/TonB-dependent receptor-like protein